MSKVRTKFRKIRSTGSEVELEELTNKKESKRTRFSSIDISRKRRLKYHPGVQNYKVTISIEFGQNILLNIRRYYQADLRSNTSP